MVSILFRKLGPILLMQRSLAVREGVGVSTGGVLPGAGGGFKGMVVGPGSVAHEKKNEVGVREPEKVQILKGLDPGEKVITVGGVGLEDRAKVKIVAAGEGEKPDKDEKPDAEDKAEKPDKK